jgi:hypothetical protein
LGSGDIGGGWIGGRRRRGFRLRIDWNGKRVKFVALHELGGGAIEAVEVDVGSIKKLLSLGGIAVEGAEAVLVGGVLPVEPGLFVVGPFEREAGLGGFGPVGCCLKKRDSLAECLEILFLSRHSACMSI